MKVLVAPLNWGLGHAARCIPLVIDRLRSGDEVILAGDGEALLLLKKHFPNLRTLPLAALSVRYSGGNSQVGAMLRLLPRLVRHAVQDHRLLTRYMQQEHFDLIIADNRFGCFVAGTRTAYITHQLHIILPAPWRFIEPLVQWLHWRVARRFDEVWVPDYEGGNNLSGALSHNIAPYWQTKLHYIGPLSRFRDMANVEPSRQYTTVAVLSGPEPQRSSFEQQTIGRLAETAEPALVVRGIIGAPPTTTKRRNITLVPYLGDEHLASVLLGAKKVIARSGYSSIMDFAALGILHKVELIPTPGQPEQQYLSTLIRKP